MNAVATVMNARAIATTRRSRQPLAVQSESNPSRLARPRRGRTSAH
jgi:hypothetical protein